jgi:AraC-like DNA-binding protein
MSYITSGRRAKMNDPTIPAGLPEQYRALLGKPELNHQVYDMLPVPMEIFAPDGTCMFMNRAWLAMINCQDPKLGVGIYNLKHDPACLGIFGQEVMDRIFRGEAVTVPDFPAPIQNVADRGVIDEKPWEAATMDMLLLPVWDGGVFTCTICVAIVKNTYEGRADVARAKAYLREHWLERFDLEALAAAAGSLSSRHLRRVFAEVTGRTPHAYYQKVKLEKIQELLLDGSLTVAEVFTACEVDSHRTYFRLFKEKTGMTPSEYRKDRLKK